MAQYREGQRLQGSDGNVYVVVNGVPTLPAASPIPPSILAPSPARLAKEAQDRARLEATDARADRREDRAESTAARAAANDAISNQLKQIELEIKREELTKGEKNANERKERIGRLNALANQIKRTRELYNVGPGTTKGVEGAMDYLPTDANAKFDTAGASLSQQGLAAFRTPGTGTVSDRDAIMFDRANLPTASTRDAAIEEQLLGLQNRVAEEYRTLGMPVPAWEDIQAATPEQKAPNEVPDPTNDAGLKAPPLVDTETGLPTDGRKITRDDRMSAQIDAMINAGASKGMIDAVLKRQNFPVVTPGEWKKIQDWRTGPGKGQKYFGADISRSEDLSSWQKVLANPAVAPVAAGAGHFSNAATAGLVGALAGEEGQGALDAAAALNPTASTLGSVAGAVTGTIGGELALARAAPTALAKYAPRMADALYGGLYGFNTAREGEGLQGAALGAGAGLAGGYLGQKAMSGVGRGMRGVQDANVGYLRQQGIPLTVGQTVGGSGQVGATVKNIEDALTSIPGVSSIVNARRTEGLEGFNQAAMRQAGAPAGIPVTAPGSQGMEQLRQGIGPAYDEALGGAQINTNDPDFAAALEQVVAAANQIPPVNGAQDAAATALASRLAGATDPDTGIMSGRGFQEAYRGLGRTGRERANGDYGYEVGQVMRQGQNTLAEALDAQNPGSLQAFRDANSVNRNANVIAQALDKAKSQQNELFTPAQINMADAMSTKRLEGPMASAAGDRPFFDLARAGQEVLPSKLPDSGTATRGLVGAGLVGGFGGAGVGSAFGDAGTGAQTGLGLTLLLAAGGSRPAQAAMTKILADRPDILRTFGDKIVNNSRIGGWTGAGILTPLAISP